MGRTAPDTWLLLLVIILGALLPVVYATHFRYGIILWQRRVLNGTSSIHDSYYFRFRVITGWDIDFPEQPFIDIKTAAEKDPPEAKAGDPFEYFLITGGGFNYGDTNSTLEVWDKDHCYLLRTPARGFVFAQCIFYKEYTGAEVFQPTEVFFLSCCRIEFTDGLRNNDDLRTRVWSSVVFDDVFVASPVTGFLPIATVPLQRGDTVAYQQFVAFDPIGRTIIFYHANTEQMSGYPENTTGWPNSVPPTGWTIGYKTGLVAWYSADKLIHADLWNAQILVENTNSNRTVAVDFLYRIQIVDKMCVGPAQGGCGETHLDLCEHDNNCTASCFGYCDFPGIPEFIDPTPPQGSLIVVYALQTNQFPIVANRTGPHCCEPGEYIWYEEGAFPLGFGDEEQNLLNRTGANPHTSSYEWTASVDQAGLHQVCWGACAANDILPGFIEVCSAPHCFGIFVSLRPNQPPVIHVPEEHWTEFGIIAYHEVPKIFYDLYVTDDSGDHDVLHTLNVDRGTWNVGHWPAGLDFLNGTNGTQTDHIEFHGSLFQINFALYKSWYNGTEGITLVDCFASDLGWEGMGQNGQGWTTLTDYEEFTIRVLPACVNPCGTNLEIMTKFYDDLKGHSWFQNNNWLQGDPCWDYWEGIYCEAGEIVAINLPENNLDGTLPCELGCLHQLQQLWLMNNEIYGLLPPKFGELRCLEHLGLSYNMLNWTLPAELGDLSRLKRMQLNNNEFIGRVPKAFANLTNLEEMLLQNNQLYGYVPAELWTLDPYYMWLDDNELDKPVPDSWSIERFYREDELERIGRLNEW